MKEAQSAFEASLAAAAGNPSGGTTASGTAADGIAGTLLPSAAALSDLNDLALLVDVAQVRRPTVCCCKELSNRSGGRILVMLSRCIGSL